MKKVLFLAVAIILWSCSNETIAFSTTKMEKKSTLPCQEICTTVKLSIPIATTKSEVADSINAHILNESKDIVYFGEDPNTSVDYEGIMQSFIQSYDDMQQKFPQEMIGWEAIVNAEVIYQSDDVVGVKIAYYNYTGGAHGYSGVRSLLIDKKDGSLLTPETLFKDVKVFKKFAEQKFRTTFKIPQNHTINSTGFMFEEDKFNLPNTIIFTDKGVVLYFNVYEIASYAEGPKQLFLTFDEVKEYLKVK